MAKKTTTKKKTTKKAAGRSASGSSSRKSSGGRSGGKKKQSYKAGEAKGKSLVIVESPSNVSKWAIVAGRRTWPVKRTARSSMLASRCERGKKCARAHFFSECPRAAA